MVYLRALVAYFINADLAYFKLEETPWLAKNRHTITVFLFEAYFVIARCPLDAAQQLLA